MLASLFESISVTEVRRALAAAGGDLDRAANALAERQAAAEEAATAAPKRSAGAPPMTVAAAATVTAPGAAGAPAPDADVAAEAAQLCGLLQGVDPALAAFAIAQCRRGTGGAAAAMAASGGSLLDAAALYILDGSAQADYDFVALVAKRASTKGGSGGDEGGGAPLSEAEKAKQKKALLRKFDEQPDDRGVVYKPSLAAQPVTVRASQARNFASLQERGGKEVRYLEGQIVHVRKGERFITETVGPAEDPGTFVSLKVKRKGTGGPSPGWGK